MGRACQLVWMHSELSRLEPESFTKHHRIICNVCAAQRDLCDGFDRCSGVLPGHYAWDTPWSIISGSPIESHMAPVVDDSPEHAHPISAHDRPVNANSH